MLLPFPPISNLFRRKKARFEPAHQIPEVDRAEDLLQKGLPDEALPEAKKGLASSKRRAATRSIAAYSLSLGLIFRYRGESDSALDYCFRGLAKFEELDKKAEMATCCNNIGLLYRDKGELNVALEFFQRGMVLAEETENRPEFAASINNIGTIRQMKGDFETASAHFERSLKIFEEIGNDLHLCEPLHNLIQLAVLEGSPERAQPYLSRLEELDSKEENRLISHIYRLAKAEVLKTSERFAKRAEAYLILQQIIKESSLRFDITVAAKSSLCEVLIGDLGTSTDTEAIAELQDLLQQLLDVAATQDNVPLLAETYWLQAKLALIKLEVKQARQLLAQAQVIAEKRGLRTLAMIISSEHDSLLGQMARLDEFIDTEASTRDQLDPSALEELVVGMLGKGMTIPTQLSEEPVMLLVLSSSNQCVFSRPFIPESQVDDQVIGGFLHAVRDIGKQIFAESETIDRIVYKEYILALKMLESLTFCYAFKGQSYSALQKLDQFMEKTHASPSIWNAFAQDIAISQDMTPDEKTEIERHIREIFYSPADQ
ncbi:MAG: tetratricopeptide repeat protein [Candidatus Hodarchaeales archaeon]